MLLCLLASCVVFVSCGNDDDDADDKAWLVGTWSTRLYFDDDFDDDDDDDDDDDGDDDGDDNEFVLKKDGTCLWMDDCEEPGRWSYSDSKLTMNFQDWGGKNQFVFHVGDKTADSFAYKCMWSSNEHGTWSTDRYHGVAYRK